MPPARGTSDATDSWVDCDCDLSAAAIRAGGPKTHLCCLAACAPETAAWSPNCPGTPQLQAPDARLETNNQWLSLTDQLRLGVRGIELDMHYFAGGLRIGHCGGLHAHELNDLVAAMNVVAKLLEHPIRWDSETVGCQPSLSSIATTDQRCAPSAMHNMSELCQRVCR